MILAFCFIELFWDQLFYLFFIPKKVGMLTMELEIEGVSVFRGQPYLNFGEVYRLIYSGKFSLGRSVSWAEIERVSIFRG